jgi:hypothetical protein
VYISVISRRNKKCMAKATEGESTTTIHEKHLKTGPLPRFPKKLSSRAVASFESAD